MTDAKIARELSFRYSWPGADREDVEQEALFAIERCRPKWRPGMRAWSGFAWLCAENHLKEIRRRECYRRPRLVSLEDRHASPGDLTDQVEARRRLRVILELPLPPRERHALDRAFVGEVIGQAARTEHMARFRAKRKILTAVA